MYQVGQKVFYSSHGVCLLLDVEQKTVDRKQVQYYALAPVDHPDARYYIPTGNPSAMSKLTPLMTREELEQALKGEKDTGVWISGESLRKQRYRELISSGDRKALIGMIHALYAHKRQQEEQGRKFHLCDENFIRDARRLIASEVAVVLDMSVVDAENYISSCLNV